MTDYISYLQIPLYVVDFLFVFQKLFAVIGPPLTEGRGLTGKAVNHTSQSS